MSPNTSKQNQWGESYQHVPSVGLFVPFVATCYRQVPCNNNT